MLSGEKPLDQLTKAEKDEWATHICNVLMDIYCRKHGIPPVKVSGRWKEGADPLPAAFGG